MRPSHSDHNHRLYAKGYCYLKKNLGHKSMQRIYDKKENLDQHKDWICASVDSADYSSFRKGSSLIQACIDLEVSNSEFRISNICFSSAPAWQKQQQFEIWNVQINELPRTLVHSVPNFQYLLTFGFNAFVTCFFVDGNGHDISTKVNHLIYRCKKY